MCGCYSNISKNKDSKGSVRAARLLKQAQAEGRFNVASSQYLPVITNDKPEELQFFSWGLPPHWAKEKGYKRKTINARAKTITEKPTFKQIINLKRCLVSADSFYEWCTTPAGKVPYRFLLKDEGLFCFAGLWDEWADRETGEVIRSYTLITTEANELMRPIHNRMLILLHPDEEELWLLGERSGTCSPFCTPT